MDPLSITASTIALLQVSKQLVKGLKILGDLSHVPDDVRDLLDELENFQKVLASIDHVLEQRSPTSDLVAASSNLSDLLVRVNAVFDAISRYCGIAIHRDKAMQSDRPLALGDADVADLDLLARFKWLKNRRVIQQYRRKIEGLRLDISNHLGSLNLMDSYVIIREIRDMAFAVRRLSMDRYQETTLPDKSDETVLANNVVSNLPRLSHPSTLPEDECAVDTSHGNAHFEKGAALLHLSSCDCLCHGAITFRSGHVFRSLFGTVNLKVNGLRNIKSYCNSASCSRRESFALKCGYRFPHWLWLRSVSCAYTFDLFGGISLSLSSTRIVARNSDLFHFAMAGDIAGVQRLFSRGLASPCDATSNYGYTALHYAINYGHLELCRFLIKAGAKIETEDFSGITAADIGYQNVCLGSVSEVVREQIFTIFNEDTWLDRKQFSVLHKIVLKVLRSHITLSDLLSVSTADIDAQDTDGRTALSWAAELGDEQSVLTLLSYHCDPQIRDKYGNTPLHYACKASTPKVLSLLISNGADVVARNRWQQTPLNWVAFFQDKTIFLDKLLVDSVAIDIDEADLGGITGIGNAAFRSNYQVLIHLLDLGADVNKPAFDSTTPLLDAISRNNHAVLSLLLQRSRDEGLDLCYRDSTGETCLRYLLKVPESEILIDKNLTSSNFITVVYSYFVALRRHSPVYHSINDLQYHREFVALFLTMQSTQESGNIGQSQDLVDFLNQNTDKAHSSAPKITTTRQEAIDYLAKGVPEYDPPLPVNPRPWKLRNEYLSQMRPDELFFHTFPGEMIQLIVEATNSKAHRDPKLSKKWNNVDDLEIRRWIGLRLDVAILGLRDMKDYWRLRLLAARFIERKRYILIERYLCLEKESEASNDNSWFWRVEKAINITRARFRELADPAAYFTVDEAIIKFLGRKADTLNMKHKPTGNGFLIFALASNDGFIHDFLLSSSKQGIESVSKGITIKKDTLKPRKRKTSRNKKGIKQSQSQLSQEILSTQKTTDDNSRSAEISLAPTKSAAYVLVKAMKDRDPQSSHIAFLDNLFLDNPMATALRDLGVGVCGTTRKNAIDIPEIVLAIHHKYSDLINYNELSASIASGGILSFTWKDNNMVTVITTSHKATDKTTKKRKRPPGNSITAKKARKEIFEDEFTKELDIPTAIDDYNHGMNGVDLANQLRSGWTIQRERERQSSMDQDVPLLSYRRCLN